MESQFPSFFDLVIWAHEHESIPKVYECAENGVHFLQPGSTVITSLCEAEMKPKHCFLLKIKQQAFTCKSLRLRCTRPFALRTIELKGLALNRPELVEQRVKEAIEEVVQRALEEHRENSEGGEIPEELKLPYIRLKVEYSGGYNVIAPRVFSRFTEGKIANPNDCVVFFKNKGFAGGLTQATHKSGAGGKKGNT